MPKPYKSFIIEEGVYKVAFSNDGTFHKFNTRKPIIRNPTRKEVRCASEGCREKTTHKSGLCKEHQKKKHRLFYEKHEVDWRGSIHPGDYAPPHYTYFKSLVRDWAKHDKKKRELVSKLFDRVLDDVVGKVPDSTALQQDYERKASSKTSFSKIASPDDVVKLIRDIVDDVFPQSKFSKEKVDYTYNVDREEKTLKNMPIRVLAALLLSALVSEEANQGDAWAKKMEGKNSNPSRTGCYMSIGWYLYMMYTDAPQNVIRMCMKQA